MAIESMHLLAVYELYIKYLESNHPVNSSVTLRREIWYTFTSCLLPGMGYSHVPTGSKLTTIEIKAARDFMRMQTLESLLDARIAQQRGFKLVARSQKMRDIYQRSLDKFLLWCGQQNWWPGERSLNYTPSSQEFFCSNLQSKHGTKAHKRLTHRRSKHFSYRLKPKEISSNLQSELNDFYQFLTKPEYPLRIGSSIRKSTADRYLLEILLFLGWFHRFKGVPLDQLNFDLLIPRVCRKDLRSLTETEQRRLFDKYQKHIEEWINSYFIFLRELMDSISPRTRAGKLDSLSVLGHFQYRTEVEIGSDYRQIEVLQVIENQHKIASQKVAVWNRNRRYVADQEQKWPIVKEGQTALSVVRQDILEPLRLECFPKNKSNKLRSGSAIAYSEQRFLAWFLLAGLPARRQEEYRDLKLSLSCPVCRPPISELPEDGVYHPLPPSEVRDQRYDGTPKDNYIYKTYFHNGKFYRDGLWIMDIQEYKMVDKYGSQSIVIKNRRFKDGTCLYDYFEHYLYGWWLPGGRKRQQIYDWWQRDLRARRGRWVSLGRNSFEPIEMCCVHRDMKENIWMWGYFFVQPQTGKQNSASSFEEFVEIAAHYCIGKQVSPHIMRAVWATWAYQIGLTDQQKSSLAYAMGHDIRTLKELYERSSPEQRRRPIEEAIDRLFFDQEVISQPIVQSAESNLLEQRLIALTKAQKQQLAAMIAQQSNEGKN